MRRPLFAACLCLLAISVLRLWLTGPPWAQDGKTDIFSTDGETVLVTGRVYQKDRQSFSLHVNSIAAVPQQNLPTKQLNKIKNIKCEYGGDPQTELRLGSMVTVRGTFQTFMRASNPGEFDTAGYYRTFGIGGRLTEITLVDCGEQYSRLREGLYRLKEYFRSRLYDVFPQKEASVMTAMLLGDKADLDDEVKELYRRSGILHILSISGLHITIIGMGIYKLFRRMGMPVLAAACCGSLLLVLYGMMTGFGLSACRAIGMYLLRMLAEVIGRTYDMLTALGVMALILVWQNPIYPGYAGFLLSFGSVLGIGGLAPALIREFEAQVQEKTKLRRRRFTAVSGRAKAEGTIAGRVWRTLISGAAIPLFTLPIQLWFYYEVPVYGIFLNLLVLPFLSLLMMTGLIVVLVPGTGLLGTLCCLILQGYEILCGGFGRLPFSVWNPGRPTVLQIVLYYLLLAKAAACGYRRCRRETGCGEHIAGRRTTLTTKESGWTVAKKRRRSDIQGRETRWCGGKRRILQIRRSAAVFRVPALLALAVLILGIHVREGNTVTFLDVGQGDGIVLETENGEVYLFDCGSSSRKKVGQYVLIPYLKYRGIRHIDAVFLSHPDEDHANGLEELFTLGAEEGITVAQLVLPGIAETERQEEFVSLVQCVKQSTQEKDVVISYIQTGDRFDTQNLSLLCLHPPSGYTGSSANAYSECFYAELFRPCRGFGTGAASQRGERKPALSLLLTGDVEGEGEERLLKELKNRNIQNVTVLKTAHHGSRNSTAAELLEQIRPSYAVISCGKDNRYGHPHRELLERMSDVKTQILQTSESGAVTVRLGRKRALIRSVFPHS